jgi:hypothetical protein
MAFHPQHYTPRFQQHVWSLMHNGFYTRALDADDFAFIESIRERGCIGMGPIADSPPALIEELGYWERHWEVEEGFERRIGRDIEKRERMREAHREQLEIMRAKRLAERAKRLADDAMAAAELAREEREWQKNQEALVKKREERLKQTMLADIEWETSLHAGVGVTSPLRGATPAVLHHIADRYDIEDYEDHDQQQRSLNYRRRHYEPIWKSEERTAPLRRKHARAAKQIKLANRRKAAQELAEQQMKEKAEQEKEKANQEKYERVAKLHAAQQMRAAEHAAKARAEATLRDRQQMKARAEQVLQERLARLHAAQKAQQQRVLCCYGVTLVVRWPHLLHPR